MKNKLRFTASILGLITIFMPMEAKGYEIKDFRLTGANFHLDLNMYCGKAVNLYASTNRKNVLSVKKCSAFVGGDSYYREYLLPKSLFKNLSANNKINVCSGNKPIFIDNYNYTDLNKCQILTVRSKDRQYVYARYVTPTHRLR